MARPLTHQALTLFAGLALIGTVVACGGRGSVPATPGMIGSNGIAAPSGSDKTTAAVSTPVPTPGGGTTYQNIRPLVLYATSGVIDFLVTPVSVAGTFSPDATGPQATHQFTVTMPCSVNQPVIALGDRHTALVTASPTPPPTPTPTNLPPSNCVIVAYANGGTTAMQVTGPALIDGNNLIFPATSPGLTYAFGTSYTFYVAIANIVATPTPAPTPSCNPDGRGDKHDDSVRTAEGRGHHGDGDDEHQCGHHEHHHGGDHHDGDHHEGGGDGGDGGDH